MRSHGINQSIKLTNERHKTLSYVCTSVGHFSVIHDVKNRKNFTFVVFWNYTSEQQVMTIILPETTERCDHPYNYLIIFHVGQFTLLLSLFASNTWVQVNTLK